MNVLTAWGRRWLAWRRLSARRRALWHQGPTLRPPVYRFTQADEGLQARARTRRARADAIRLDGARIASGAPARPGLVAVHKRQS